MVRVLAAFFVLLVLAGCAKAPAEPASTALPLETMVETGPVSGLVTSDELIPIEGAKVEVLGADLRTQTDAAGAFSFSHVAVGDQTLLVSADGFVEKKLTTRVTQEPGPRVDFVLKTLASKEPYLAETFGVKAYFYYAYNVTNPVTGEVISWDSYQISDLRDQFTFKFERGWSELFLELEWDPSTPIAERLQLQVGLPARGSGVAHTYPVRFFKDGGSPFSFTLTGEAYEAERAKDPNIVAQKDSEAIRGILRPTNPSGRPVSFYAHQEVTVYGSAAYNAPFPSSYSRIGQGD